MEKWVGRVKNYSDGGQEEACGLVVEGWAQGDGQANVPWGIWANQRGKGTFPAAGRDMGM